MPTLNQLIRNSLAPATVIRIESDPDSQHARVLVRDDELSLAIGKGGQNVRLTAKLTGYQIDVTSPEELERAEAEREAAEAEDVEAAETAEAGAESPVESEPNA